MRIEVVTKEWVSDRVTPNLLVDNSFEFWAVYVKDKPAVVLGALRFTLLGASRIWMVPLDIELMHDRQFIRAMRLITRMGKEKFGALLAATQTERDARFAEFCGLRLVGEIEGMKRYEL